MHSAASTAQASGLAKPKDTLEANFSKSLPANARELDEAIKAAKAGDSITLRGRVASSADAIDPSKAVFTLVADSTSVSGGTADRASSASAPSTPRCVVRIVNASGKPFAESLVGKYGLKAGAEVFVVGDVQSVSGSDELVVNARSVHVPRASLPAGFFQDAPQENVKDVSEARKTGGLKVGDDVVLKGRIGGSAEPFVEGRAIFTIVGRGLKACNENPDDKCSKPWDYCCDPKDEILANSATVQVVDAKGGALKTDLKGRRGLKELSEVIVIGTVAVADGKAIVINATAMSVPKN